MARAWLAVCLGGALGACVVDEEPELELGEVVQEAKCNPMACGMNSPTLGKWGFHELDVLGATNDEGFWIKSFRRNGAPHFPYVSGSRLWAYDYATWQWVWGQDVAGSEFVIGIGSREFLLRVKSVGEMTYPVPEDTADPLETYVLEWAPSSGGVVIGDVWRNVCSGFPGGPGDWGGGSGTGEDLQYWEQWELLGQDPIEAVLFEGDRIDGTAYEVQAAPDWSWFNIGCAGHTVSKLHLTRNTIASGYGMPWNERQATLKMLAADYCGTGHAFTVSGQRLVWQDPHGIVEFFRYPTTLEARWNEYGAACLDYPRMLSPSTPNGIDAFPDLMQQIKDACGGVLPPSCGSPWPWDFDGQLRVSAIP
jgi:hypothetical protein